jgi:hypothetical protein
MSGKLNAPVAWVEAARNRLADEREEARHQRKAKESLKKAQDQVKRAALMADFPGYDQLLQRIKDVVKEQFLSIGVDELCWVSFTTEGVINILRLGPLPMRRSNGDYMVKDELLHHVTRLYGVPLTLDMEWAFSEDLCAWAKRTGLEAAYKTLEVRHSTCRRDVPSSFQAHLPIPLLLGSMLHAVPDQDFPCGLKEGDHVVCLQVPGSATADQ